MQKYAVWLAIVSVAILCNCASGGEVEVFQQCFDKHKVDCFAECSLEANPSGWDYWSSLLLGQRVARGRPYPPCEARCLTTGHIECSELNWSNGGKKTFKMFGKWPIKPLLGIEEFASFFFSGTSLLLYIWLSRRYTKAVQEEDKGNHSFGFEGLTKYYYLAWMVTFATAMLFHIKDTPLTEKLDYYSAFLAIAYTSYLSLIRLLWVRDIKRKVLVAVPYLLYCSYHIWYMTFVSFDYGYNIKVIVIGGICNGLMWLSWAAIARKSYAWRVILAQTTLWSLSIFEFFDFPPVYGYVDPHAIWHACIMLVGILYTNFLIADATHFLSKPWLGKMH